MQTPIDTLLTDLYYSLSVNNMAVVVAPFVEDNGIIARKDCRWGCRSSSQI